MDGAGMGTKAGYLELLANRPDKDYEDFACLFRLTASYYTKYLQSKARVVVLGLETK